LLFASCYWLFLVHSSDAFFTHLTQHTHTQNGNTPEAGMTKSDLNPLEPRDWLSTLEVFGVKIQPDARAATAITWDSRKANQHTAFAALSGETEHGNKYVLTDLDVPRAVRVSDATTALRAWARAWRLESKATIIGVTGSAGKTTARSYIAAALNCQSNYYNTLNAIACYQLSSVSPDTTHVLELGIDRIGEMDELVALTVPDVGMITSVGAAHLEFFGSLEQIAFEKGRILEGRTGLVAASCASLYPGVPSYGFQTGVTYPGSALRLEESRVSFRFHDLPVSIPNPSEKVAEAALGALALADQMKLELESAIARVQSIEVPGARMRIEQGQNYKLIDDSYNANPLSVNASLDTLERQPGRKVVILGDMRELGETSPELHAQIGARAGQLAALVIGVGEYAEIIADAARGSGARSSFYPNSGVAALEIEQHLKTGDTVLVKGSLSVKMKLITDAIRTLNGEVRE
jgi:UDP-N-acetylmuramoyl-tripeptide--D-alanyl-D-alanine ligase